MAELERRYAGKPVHFFHVVTGENAIQALDFKKHYRSDATYLLDTTYEVATAYGAMVWPTDLIVDPAGRIARYWPGEGLLKEGNPADAIQVLDELAANAKGGPPKGTYCTGDRCFVRPKGELFEVQPTMTTDAKGRVHLVYVGDQGGVGDLYHRILDAGNWSEPQRITRSAADDYSPFVCPDPQGGVRLVWCSDRGSLSRYDVYTRRFDGTSWSPAERVTQSDDDAAHPRAVMDSRGNFWVTYYRWIPWSKGVSRDREVFVRYYDGNAWSDEMQISPADVPRYEDHTDPAIAADGGGSVWVAWTWDTHPEEKSWSFAPTFGSALFTRQLRAGQPPSRLQMVAMRAPSLQAAMNDVSWAFLPDLYCRGDRPWFIFETHSVRGEHACGVTTYDVGEGFPAPTRLGSNPTFVCTPRFVVDRNGRMSALWSAPIGAHYAVRVAALDEHGGWGAERTVWSAPDTDLRFAAGAFDAQNKLWIAAVQLTPGHSKVIVQLDSD